MKQETKNIIISGLAGALFGLIIMWALLAPPIQAVIP